jgi:4-amino-4-deoxy-L-arabinose transferase-like glycosyltransferase
VYLLSVDLLRHGQELGTDVFAPQPPAFYDLLRLLSVISGESIEGLRWATIAVVLVATIAAFALGTRLVGVAGGLACAAPLVVAPPLPLLGARIVADNPGIALAVVALTLAALAGRRRGFAVAAGACLALAALVKLSALSAAPSVALLLVLAGSSAGRARRLALAAAGAVSATVLLLLPHAGALGELWESNVTYHERARSTEQILDPWHELGRFFDPHVPFVWLVVAGGLLTVLLHRRRPTLWVLWLWAALAVVFLVTHRPLHENHLVVLPFAFGLPAGVALGATVQRLGRRGAVTVVAVVALAVASGYVQQVRRLDEERTPPDPALAWAAELLRERTRPDALVVSDQPLVPFLAGRRVPGALVDTARLRFETGSLSDADIVAALGGAEAVVAGRSFTQRPALLAAIAGRFPVRLDRGGVTVYLRR